MVGAGISYGEFSWRTLIAMAAIAILWDGCSSRHDVLPISEAADIKLSAILPSPPFGEVFDALRVDDSTFAISDVAARGIYLYWPHTGRTRQLGSRGRGPGEYVAPAQLALLDSMIYFKELAEPTVGALPLAPNQRAGRSWHLGHVMRTFCASPWGKFYVLTVEKCPLLEFDEEWQEEKRYCGFPERYRDVIVAIYGGGLCCSRDGSVFFAHTAPYRIWVADSSLESVRAFITTPPEGYHPFPESTLGGKFRTIPRSKRKRILSTASRILGVYCGAGGLVFVAVTDPEGKWRALLHVYDGKGRALRTIGLPRTYPVRIQGNDLIGVVPEEGGASSALQVFGLKSDVLLSNGSEAGLGHEDYR